VSCRKTEQTHKEELLEFEREENTHNKSLVKKDTRHTQSSPFYDEGYCVRVLFSDWTQKAEKLENKKSRITHNKSMLEKARTHTVKLPLKHIG
jgi:hypothetical protein